MRRLPILAIACLLATAQVQSSMAQTATSTRQVYTQAREELDALIMQRRLGDAIRMFDEIVEVDEAELETLDAQIQELYQNDFESVGLVRSEVLKNGFRQELIAYWTGRDYLYLYLFMHTDGSEIRLLNFRFDSDFHVLNDLF